MAMKTWGYLCAEPRSGDGGEGEFLKFTTSALVARIRSGDLRFERIDYTSQRYCQKLCTEGRRTPG